MKQSLGQVLYFNYSDHNPGHFFPAVFYNSGEDLRVNSVFVLITPPARLVQYKILIRLL